MSTRRIPVIPSFPFPGSDITGDVLEFVKAMEVYQRRYHRRYPAWSEVLYVLRTLGYAKRVAGATWEMPELPPEVIDRTADDPEPPPGV